MYTQNICSISSHRDCWINAQTACREPLRQSPTCMHTIVHPIMTTMSTEDNTRKGTTHSQHCTIDDDQHSRKAKPNKHTGNSIMVVQNCSSSVDPVSAVVLACPDAMTCASWSK